MAQDLENNQIFINKNYRLNKWAQFISKWSALGAIALIGIVVLIALIEPNAMGIGIVLSPIFIGLLFISGIFFCIQYYTEK